MGSWNTTPIVPHTDHSRDSHSHSKAANSACRFFLRHSDGLKMSSVAATPDRSPDLNVVHPTQRPEEVEPWHRTDSALL